MGLLYSRCSAGPMKMPSAASVRRGHGRSAMLSVDQSSSFASWRALPFYDVDERVLVIWKRHPTECHLPLLNSNVSSCLMR